jgi:hypothetical protein
MEYGYIIDTPKYNSKKGLYDVQVKIDKDTRTLTCNRILNPTILKYTQTPGYFLISPDNKYIFINDKVDINTLLKNIVFSNNNYNYTNEDILEINIDPIKKYTQISFIDIPEDSCINFILEDNDSDRKYQISKNSPFMKYDCLVSNILNMSNNSFTNIEPKKSGIFETMSHYLTGAPSVEIDEKHGNSECKVTVNSVMEDVHQYNTFYVYGLTSLNLLFVIIIIIMVFNIVQDSDKIRKIPKKSIVDF